MSAEILAGQRDATAPNRHQAGQGLDQGRLAGAVRPEQGQDFAFGEGEVDAAHDVEAGLVARDQIPDLERRRHAAPPEPCLGDARVGTDLGGAALDQKPALGHHQDRIAEAHDEVHIVLDDEEGDAARG